jgi:hypothetical protein
MTDLGPRYDSNGVEFTLACGVRENWSGIVGTLMVWGPEECRVRWPSKIAWVKTAHLLVVPESNRCRRDGHDWQPPDAPVVICTVCGTERRDTPTGRSYRYPGSRCT